MRKIREDNGRMSVCGRTSWWRCIKKKESFPECKDCKQVNRKSDKWKMIDHKPHKRCKACGEFLPLWRFYHKQRVLKSGNTSEVYSASCKMCISAKRFRKKGEQEKAT